MSNVIPLFPNQEPEAPREPANPLEPKYMEIIQKLLKAHAEGRMTLAIVIVPAAKDVTEVAKLLWQLEPRFLYRAMHKREYERRREYSYLASHILVMSRSMFRNDADYLKALAEVNKLLIVSDKPVELPPKAKPL